MIPTLLHPAEPPSTTAPLGDWLTWLETIHPVAIDMGLDRVGRVADRLGLRPARMPLLLVGGTNGKGSTVGMLSAIYRTAGYRVGAYTSPHFVDFRERIRIDGQMADAQHVVDALAFVESGRAPETLTYFEYTTLAAMQVFNRHACDVCILEVGLGGRLDATNIWDADCAIVTSIALDHADFLGDDVAVIATEKAAIGRMSRPLIVGQPQPPETLLTLAQDQGMQLQLIGDLPEHLLPQTNLPGLHQRRNAACAVAAVDSLQSRLPVADTTLDSALQHVHIMARFEQRLHSGVTITLDVAHNPAGADALCRTWQAQHGEQSVPVIFAALSDKDIPGIVQALDAVAGEWHCVPLSGSRALPVQTLADVIEANSRQPVVAHETLEQAWQQARASALSGSRQVLVAGSFHTVGLMQQLLDATDGTAVA